MTEREKEWEAYQLELMHRSPKCRRYGHSGTRKNVRMYRHSTLQIMLPKPEHLFNGQFQLPFQSTYVELRV